MSLHDERNAAEQEYINSQKDLADTQVKQAEEMKDFGAFSNEALKNTNEYVGLKDTLARASANTALEGVTQVQADAQRHAAVAEEKRTKYKEELDSAIEKRQKKNQLIMGYKQLASNRAKMKYDLAAQRLAQAQAGWTTARNLLTTLGCMVSLIPGVGTAIGAGLMVGGTAMGAIGSAAV